MNKILAIYLPAYHRIKENDEWWGDGFTEWDNVKNAQSLYAKHEQPIHPIGYYDLSKKEDIEAQLKLAKKYNVFGFIFYHYWFGDEKKLLERPAEILRDEIKTDTNYCFCWANETWATTWHGKMPKNLCVQKYPGAHDWKKHLEYLLTFFVDKRYIKIDNKPVLFIYKPCKINDYDEMISYFNDALKEKGFGGIYVVEYISSKNKKLYSMKSDAVTEFEPLYTTFFDISKINLLKRFICKKLKRIDFQNYNYLWNKIIHRKRTYYGKPIFRGGFVGWDNSPRKGKNSMIVKGGNPVNFKNNLKKLIETQRKDANEYIVLNAWNEWSEGAFLEPSEEYGYKYLEVIKEVVK